MVNVPGKGKAKQAVEYNAYVRRSHRIHPKLRTVFYHIQVLLEEDISEFSIFLSTFIGKN